MTEFYHKKTHRDAIWVYHARTVDIQEKICDTIKSAGFRPVSTSKEWKYCQYNLPVLWQRDQQIVSWRVEDSLFMEDPEAWTRPKPNAIISDNIPLQPIAGYDISLYPEHMWVYGCDIKYQDHNPTYLFNCFMNRISGDRSIVFYELLRRKLLDQGLVSFNCFRPGDNRNLDVDPVDHSKKNYDWQYESADLVRYQVEHEQGRGLVPYNNIEPAGLDLEQAIIDSRLTVILETYISDDHIVFSEKIFRNLQIPRPWMLYSSPGAIAYLRSQGFDLLDDYVNHDYDLIKNHFARLLKMVDQLEQFQTVQYTHLDYARFQQAAEHNQKLLKHFEQQWPAKFDCILNEIKGL